MKNNLRGAKMVLANGNDLDQLKLGGSNMSAIASNGEINAYDKRDALQQIGNFLQSISSGETVKVKPADQLEQQRQVMAAAHADQTGDSWAALGAALAERIEEQASRDGFLRRLSQGSTLNTGEVPRVPMSRHEAEAIVATAPAELGYQLVRSRIFNPPEFEIKHNVRVSQLDLDQVSGQMLDDAFQDGLEAIMVKEDRLWKQAADKTVGAINPLTYIAGELTPKYLAELRNTVTDWNLPAKHAILSNDYWNDISGSQEWATMLDPVTRYDLVANGQVATLQGMNLITDGFRSPNQKVLGKGEIYVVSSAEHHAAYSTRGGVRSNPTDGANSGDTSKGWLLHEMFSFVLANPRSVAKGIRI